MGIQGLLPLLKSIHKPCSLKQFAGQTIGVDAYGWLHRGTVSCAMELALDKPTTKYVDFAMSRVRMLKHFGVTPYIVFDGDYLPSKSKTEKERAARRKESRKQGLQLLDLGKTSQAYLEFQKAVDVTPEMAGLLIEELKRNNVKYVVAPYEADSQLAYLERKGIIDGILSEDSDLLVFGAKRLLTKLDQYGECVLIRRDDFTACREISLVGWSDQEFRRMAIMSGCDYLASMDKMGLKTAYRLIRKHKTLEKIIRAIQFDGKFKVPQNYLQDFAQAELTFLHQWVYCPLANELVNYTPLGSGTEPSDLPFIGSFVEASIATGVARGELHPHTKDPLKLPNVPRRWIAPSANRQQDASTPDLKKHKSIDSFFKPKRIPLAELDPNMFAGTPEQQQMARRASGSSWPATPVSQQPANRRTITPLFPASVPVPPRRAISDSLARKPGSDRAPKRQRLCTDGSSPVSAKDNGRVEYGRSKFFANAESTASPSRPKSGRKSTDFSLWSDDSIEEALLDLPDPEDLSQKLSPGKRAKIFFTAEASTGVEADGEVDKDGISQQTNTTTTTSVFSQQRDRSATPSSSVESSQGEDSSELSPFDISLLAEVDGLRAKFSFNPGLQKSFTKGSLGRTQSGPVGATTRTPVLKQSPMSSKPGEGPIVPGHPDSPRLKFQSSVMNTREKSPPEVDIEDSAWQEAGGNIVVPGSDAAEPPSPKIHGLPKLSVPMGSEDLLVSESEAEEEAGCATPKAKAVIDLGRFAFIP